MSKLVLSMGVSLDGLVARPARLRAGGWGLPPDDPSLKQRKLGWMQDIGLHLMGRNTYEEMAGFWPTSDDPYAAPMNEIPKVVFSRTLERADWPDSRIARGALADEIAALKLGEGLPLFKDLTVPLRLALVDAQTYATGAALHVYRPVRD